MSAENYTYFYSDDLLIKDIVVITGVARSGTTILGKIVSTLENVEYEFEPWLFFDLLFRRKSNEINDIIFKDLLYRYINEISLNHILGRNINLRISDDSRKDISKSINEIKWRWDNLSSMLDVKKYIKNNKIILIIKYPDLIPFLPVLYRFIPTIKVIHIWRNPYHVSYSIKNKKWYTKTYMSNDLYIIKKKNNINENNIILPFWVDNSNYKQYINNNEYENALLSWIIQYEEHMDNLNNNILNLNLNDHIIINYENLILEPESNLDRIALFLKKNKTNLSKVQISAINKNILNKYSKNVEHRKVRKEYETRINIILEFLKTDCV